MRTALILGLCDRALCYRQQYMRGPRPDYDWRPDDGRPEPNKQCDATKYFKPWTASPSSIRPMGPRPDYVDVWPTSDYSEIEPAKCAQPTRDCFENALLHNTRGPGIESYAWNQIKDGRFSTCPADCVGFNLDNGGEVLRLCSLTMNLFTPRFDREKNYIGFIFGAVRKNGIWYYNENIYRLVKV